MSRVLTALAALLLLLLLGCGGGGGGGGSSTDGTTGTTQTTYSGRVIDVATGIAVSPAVTAAIGGVSTTTDPDVGTFEISAPRTSNQVSLTGTPYGNWTFPFPATSDATLDLGDLYIGPNRVNVTGTVTDASTGNPIPGAVVTFGGRTGTANAAGEFTISGVAYSNATQSGFFGIVGQATATGYIASSFDANGITAVDGIVTVGEIRLFSSGDVTPPDGPYNLAGLVKNKPSGTSVTVELLQDGTVIRTAPSRTDDRYYFWVEPGLYSIRATAGTASRTVDVTVNATNVIVTQDITLPSP